MSPELLRREDRYTVKTVSSCSGHGRQQSLQCCPRSHDGEGRQRVGRCRSTDEGRRHAADARGPFVTTELCVSAAAMIERPDKLQRNPESGPLNSSMTAVNSAGFGHFVPFNRKSHGRVAAIDTLIRTCRTVLTRRRPAATLCDRRRSRPRRTGRAVANVT